MSSYKLRWAFRRPAFVNICAVTMAYCGSGPVVFVDSAALNSGRKYNFIVDKRVPVVLCYAKR